MRRFVLFVTLILTASLSFAGSWTGPGMWAETNYKGAVLGGFQDGYFVAVRERIEWTPDEQKAWGAIDMNFSTALSLHNAIDAFYTDPANVDVGNIDAMRICLERLIAKTPDGPRLLRSIGVDLEGLFVNGSGKAGR
jgi:hypothetical protein